MTTGPGATVPPVVAARLARWLSAHFGAVVALVGVAATLWVAWWQISAKPRRGQRARARRAKPASHAGKESAATSRRLRRPRRPICDAAIARAALAAAVLGDKLPPDFVERVRQVRAVSFPHLVSPLTFLPKQNVAFPTTPSARQDAAAARLRALLELLRKAQRERTVTCRALEHAP